jgi:hypothetical protein
MAMDEALKMKFLRAYANLPEPERTQIVVFVDDKPYTWNVVNVEVSDDTELGEKMLEKMKQVEVL